MSTKDRESSSFEKSKLSEIDEQKIGIAVSEWNKDITSGLLEGAMEVLKSAGILSENIFVEYVPGSYELPLGAQFLLEYRMVDAVICLGCVIRGETAHFDFVCEACSQGVKDVGLKYNVPVMFGVLTDDNKEQSLARSGGKLGNKGAEAANAALEMLSLKQKLAKPKGKVGF
ncbi:MAG: 6,7-dimethyl-8-ribityllumazine synthase [Flavobacteriales bacterium]|nr:6,7-dimethyl-8-ribityllumazine synthase [Flavobacteriales bacterium]